NRIGPVGVRELAGSGLLGGLRELGLDANDLGPDGLAALLAAAWVPGLAAVELADNRLGPAEARAVAAAAWPNLVALDLSRNPLGTDGTEGLAKAGFLPRLRRLAVSRCGLGPGGAGALFAGRLGALAEDGSLSKLAALDLEFNDIESAGAEAVATSEALGAIVSLNLAGNRITAAGAEALAESDVLGSVEELDLTTNPIGDGGAVAL